MADTLVLTGLSKTFGQGPLAVRAVRDVNLAARDGEISAIVGPSGSGKTTLLSMAGCLLTPTAGSVTILGEDVTRLGQGRRAGFRLHHIGFVFQSFNLLGPLSARENVEIALNLGGVSGRAAHTRANELLELFEIDHRANVHPTDLSGGEQQRLAIARALANRPELILADEPTASLDSRAGRRAMELMKRAVAEGEARSLVVVTHDARILDLVDRVFTMEDGVVSGGSRKKLKHQATALSST